MTLIKELKSFVMRGNVVDMAVGIIIGASFGKIVSSLVSDILMPPVGVLIGRMDFSSLAVTLMEKTETHAAVVIRYGLFINMVTDFVIVAFAMFMVIKGVNRFLKKSETVPDTKECPKCLMKIPVHAKRCGHCTSDLP